MLPLPGLWNLLQRRHVPFWLLKNSVVNIWKDGSLFLIRAHLSAPGLVLPPLLSAGWCPQAKLVRLLFEVVTLTWSTSYRVLSFWRHFTIQCPTSTESSSWQGLSLCLCPQSQILCLRQDNVLRKVYWVIFVVPLGRMCWSLLVIPTRRWPQLPIVGEPSSSCPETDSLWNFTRQLQAGRHSWHEHCPPAFQPEPLNWVLSSNIH